jgi:hypothetical protein
MKEVVCHHRLKEVFAKDSTIVTRDRALTMTKTSKKEKKGSLTIYEGKSKVQEEGERKEEKEWF